MVIDCYIGIREWFTMPGVQRREDTSRIGMRSGEFGLDGNGLVELPVTRTPYSCPPSEGRAPTDTAPATKGRSLEPPGFKHED